MVTLLLVFIFISNRLIHFLGMVSSGQIAAGALVYLITLQIPYLLGSLMSGGMYFAMLLAFGRLHLDSEMTALYTGGFSKAKLVKYSLMISFFVAILVTALTLWVNPLARYQSDRLQDNQVFSSLIMTMLPGRFEALNDGRSAVFIRDLSQDKKKMQDVFFVQTPKKPNQPWTVLSSKGGYQHQSVEGDSYVVATHGYQYKGLPGQQSWQIMKFDKLGVRVSSPKSSVSVGYNALSTPDLFKRAKADPGAVAALQWRFSMPISAIVLALLAVPLSRARPRQGKLTFIIPGLLVYIFYANMMFITNSWVGSQAIPSWLGMWWLHGLMLLFGAGMLLLQDGGYARLKARWTKT